MNLATSLIDYRTHREERMPDIGVYYVFDVCEFPKARVGLCRGFHLDLDGLRRKEFETLLEGKEFSLLSFPEIIVPEEIFYFRDEEKLFEYLERSRRQAIRTVVSNSVSFKQLSFLIAQIHFDQFLKRHPWIVEV